ncbi:MAG TPA: hypothetical protein VKJ47_10110 [Candidatus Binatia bacterium]|nr:hypothetical protein [Candidatus Binatia bacterium]
MHFRGRFTVFPLVLLALNLPGTLRSQAGEPGAAADIAPGLVSTKNTDALAGTLRRLLVKHAPQTLCEASPGWGETTRVANGVKWSGKHLPIHPHLMYSEKNDGQWRKFRVTPEDLADTLVFDLRNVRNAEPGRMTFDAFLSFDARVYYEKQDWDAGIRLYSGSARVRLRVKLLLRCEVTTRLEKYGTIVPDAVFRLRVTQAELGYDNFVVEHIAGVGGEAAKLLGDAAKGAIHEWRPSLERDLLARADAAIVKAGDTKEVRLGLGALFNGQNALADSALKLLPK